MLPPEAVTFNVHEWHQSHLSMAETRCQRHVGKYQWRDCREPHLSLNHMAGKYRRYHHSYGTVYSGESVNVSQGDPLTQGLIAYYPLNGNANDESGNNNNGIVNGATLTAGHNESTNGVIFLTVLATKSR